MKEQKVVITDNGEDLEKYLVAGWLVKGVTALHVTCGENSYTTHGKASYVLEREKKKLDER